MNRTLSLPLSLVFILCAPLCATAVTIETVPVGNAGNVGELSGESAPDGFGPDAIVGGVDYEYRIGKYEVTNAQYSEFLNAKAASDPLALYNTSMGSGNGGIARSGSSGSYSYATIAGRADMPVNYVIWYDAVRFANWLHNGQGSGDTETGAYTILGGTPTPSNALSITRNSGATWFLPSEDEWYKAAYHKNDGATGNYFDFPTSSDTTPIDEAPPGGSNSANNFFFGESSPTDVGAYMESVSPYGTFDQAGNVWEWNEALILDVRRGLRGGAFVFSFWDSPLASLRGSIDLNGEFDSVGFRVATVPEPSTGMLAVLACGLMWMLRKRFK